MERASRPVWDIFPYFCTQNLEHVNVTYENGGGGLFYLWFPIEMCSSESSATENDSTDSDCPFDLIFDVDADGFVIGIESISSWADFHPDCLAHMNKEVKPGGYSSVKVSSYADGAGNLCVFLNPNVIHQGYGACDLYKRSSDGEVLVRGYTKDDKLVGFWMSTKK